MKTFLSAIRENIYNVVGFEVSGEGSIRFTFGENDEYELWLERLIFDDQYYLALYKNKEPMMEKIVIKPGYQGEDTENI